MKKVLFVFITVLFSVATPSLAQVCSSIITSRINEFDKNTEAIKKYDRLLDYKWPETYKNKDLTAEEYQDLWRDAYFHEVATQSKLGKYDPNGWIGFCFGRAMAAHFLALKMGIPEDRLVKIFVMSDMRHHSQPDQTQWRFHVTLGIKKLDGNIVTIDPIMGGPLFAKDWIARVRENWDSWKRDPENNQIIHIAKFYLTSADAVVPNLRISPNSKESDPEKHILHLDFEPIKRGFTESNKLNLFVRDTLYIADDVTQGKFFDGVRVPGLKFNFQGARIRGFNNDELLSYNNFFMDLLNFEAPLEYRLSILADALNTRTPVTTGGRSGEEIILPNRPFLSLGLNFEIAEKKGNKE